MRQRVYWNPAGLATGATFDAQVSVAEGSNVFAGMALPVLGHERHRTHTVHRRLDRNNGGSGGVTPATLSTTNVGVTVVQTVVSGLVIGTTVRLVTGGIETFESRTTVDFDAGAMWSAGNLRLGVVGRNLTQPEFERWTGTVALKRQVRIGAALTPRSLPTGVHGPFSLAFDADLTTTPSRGGRPPDGCRWWGILAGSRAYRWSGRSSVEHHWPSQAGPVGGPDGWTDRVDFRGGSNDQSRRRAREWSVWIRVTF